MPDKQRFPVDGDAFDAGVKKTPHPACNHAPMTVYGDPENRRDIALDKTLTKGVGAETAETIAAIGRSPDDQAPERMPLPHERGIEERGEKRERLEKTIDIIRDKYGARSIQPGNRISDGSGIHQTPGSREEEGEGMNKKTCCFSGHRPEGLPGGGDEQAAETRSLKSVLHRSIERAVGAGYIHFISGMSRGIDFWAAEHILFLREDNPALTLEAAIPCAGQADRWDPDDRRRYTRILALADKVTQLLPRYTPDCFQKRNQYMVDKSALLIAVWNGLPSGTGNCVRYAREKGIGLEILDSPQGLFTRPEMLRF